MSSPYIPILTWTWWTWTWSTWFPLSPLSYQINVEFAEISLFLFHLMLSSLPTSVHIKAVAFWPLIVRSQTQISHIARYRPRPPLHPPRFHTNFLLHFLPNRTPTTAPGPRNATFLEKTLSLWSWVPGVITICKILNCALVIIKGLFWAPKKSMAASTHSEDFGSCIVMYFYFVLNFVYQCILCLCVSMPGNIVGQISHSDPRLLFLPRMYLCLPAQYFSGIVVQYFSGIPSMSSKISRISLPPSLISLGGTSKWIFLSANTIRIYGYTNLVFIKISQMQQ